MAFNAELVLIIDPSKLRTILVTDCGSTTTKALLFEKTAAGWRQTCRGEAPTTVEAPTADVTVGALNAFEEVAEISGRAILKKVEAVNAESTDSPFELTSHDPKNGIDLYLSTSSAGGGLQMVVMGLAMELSASAGLRAALGAGAIVLDTVAIDDRREDLERIKRLRHLKPDIVLICGGTDGGARKQVFEIIEILISASPRPRFGDTLKLPVIFAGNSEIATEATELLSGLANIAVVSNVFPSGDREDLLPAREAIHEFFLSHVMSHAPGYGRLMRWSPVKIQPTPLACGDVVQLVAKRLNLSVLAVDIGGATTDVFSVIKHGEQSYFHRTVSANLGMSYSVGNVLLEAGAENIGRWLPYDLPHGEIKDRLRNKMIRPTSIPQTLEDLALEQAVCREALRLSLAHHRSLAKPIRKSTAGGIASIFSQNEEELFSVDKLDLVIGSGGVLSHAPQRLSAALMMTDAFCLTGVVELAVDSVFMLPHLGVLASVHPDAAEEILFADCLVRVCYLIAPVGESLPGRVMATVFFNDQKIGDVLGGKIAVAGREFSGQRGTLTVRAARGYSVGRNSLAEVAKEIVVGSEGFLMDGREKPIVNFGLTKQQEIYSALGFL